MKTYLLPLALSCAQLSLSAEEATFGRYLPKDCAVYFEAYHDGGFLQEGLLPLVFEQRDLALEMAEERFGEEIPNPQGGEEEILKAAGEAGNHFVFALGGEGNQFAGELGKVYHEFSGLMAGLQFEVLLNLAEAWQEEGEVSAEAMAGLSDADAIFENLDQEQLGVFLDSLVEEERLAIPSVYLAVKPTATGMAEAWTTLNQALQDHAGESPYQIVEEDGKWPRRGMTFLGQQTAGRELEEWWQEAGAGERGPLDEKRFQALKAALDEMAFTVLWAQVDDWLVFYAGNGPGGFELVESSADSLAADGKLADLVALSGEAESWMRWRVSEEFLQSVPHWLNDAPSVRAQAQVVTRHPELENGKVMSDGLYEVAKMRSLLSRREVESAWSGIGWLEDGLRIETVGGMRKPGLDYEAEWSLQGGAGAAGSFLQAHWVGEEGRLDWQWQQGEALLKVLEGALGEWFPSEMMLSRELMSESLPAWLTELAAAGRELEFEGLGREQVLAMDLEGEMPQLPDLSPEMLKEGRIPRLLWARSVADRAKVSAAGAAMKRATEKFLTRVGEEMGETVPFPGFMTSEDEGLDSNFLLLPFSNEDFLLNIALNDEVLILGTSRLQARLFELGRQGKAAPGTGLKIEMDLKRGSQFLQLWDVLAQTKAFAQADALLGEEGLGGDQSLREKLAQLRRLRYHHREEAGELRTSFAVELAE
ncbi:hypothetical protein [Roseibacillus ishigakijimensis]|uniref:Uncharacterized protein n=1 Tax=Roseibacillus ishigakijimensis TaxID=454146 RepID=A0A934RWB7_9BACT|nr:hypothetical protein [Roseibacillus ishigakijimensis]MBK1835626.1 hypothetical protein [Roseibacillus ishigakijimensis]